MKLNLIHVVERLDNRILKISTFENDNKGNDSAESLWRHCAEENGFSEEEITNITQDTYEFDLYNDDGYRISIETNVLNLDISSLNVR